MTDLHHLTLTLFASFSNFTFFFLCFVKSFFFIPIWRNQNNEWNLLSATSMDEHFRWKLHNSIYLYIALYWVVVWFPWVVFVFFCERLTEHWFLCFLCQRFHRLKCKHQLNIYSFFIVFIKRMDGTWQIWKFFRVFFKKFLRSMSFQLLCVCLVQFE